MNLRFATLVLVVCGAVAAMTTIDAQRGQGAPPAQGQAGRGQGRGQGGQGGRGGPAGPITIRAARVLDGRGATLANAVVEVQGSKITAIDQRTGPVTYDLGNATVLPGMMDVHVHLN